MAISMTGKDFKKFREELGYKFGSGTVCGRINSIDDVPDTVEGVFDLDTKEFTCEGDTKLVVRLLGGPKKTTSRTRSEGSSSSYSYEGGCLSGGSSC